MNEQLALLLTAAGTGVVLVVAGWVLVRVARRAAAGTLKRNQVAGIQTSVTLSSDTAWRAAHVAAERDSVRGALGLIAGGMMAAASSLLTLVGVPFSIAVTTFTLIALSATTWLLVWTLRGTAIGQRAATQAIPER